MVVNNEKPVIVRLENVSLVSKSEKGAPAEILRDISFSAKAGDITVIIGPSGGGKSSLVRLINRLAEPTSGKIVIGKTDITEADPLQLRRNVSLVPQKPFMFEGTVLDNLQRPFVYRQEPLPGEQSEEVRRALSLVKLEQTLLLRDARTLSVGQQQRVSLARALITMPQVLLLDEPTSALDRRTADSLSTTLQDICRSQSLAIILVTHDLRLAERVADHCLYLEGGRILEEGRTVDLLTRPQSPELRRFLAEPSVREGE